MSESGSCLAIAEKRGQRQRLGGCVSVLFQLFEWNRRLAKKKVFSRKLLAPGRVMKAAKSFGGDEKMPKAKILLIADENGGSYPISMKNGTCNSDKRREMKAPSLVARLMGLESMPTSSREKPKKTLVPESVDDGNESFTCSQNLQGTMRVESRPQKLQKTSECEKHAVVTRFDGESFQIKNVLSRSRKHHHSKLPSPIKSLRVSSGRNVTRTRLIDVASRILEPGLQSHYRDKGLLTYPSSMDEVARVRSSSGQSSCKNCVESLDVIDLRLYEQQCGFPSSFGKYACEGAPNSVLAEEKDTILEKPRSEACTVFKYRAEKQNQSSLAKDRVSSRDKFSDGQNRRVSTAANSTTERKDFVSLNRSSIERIRPRAPYKAENSNLGNERKSRDLQPKLRSPVRKRTASVNECVESRDFSRSKFEKGRNFHPDAFPHPRVTQQKRNRATGIKNGEAISFSFNSPVSDKREQNDFISSKRFQEPSPLHGDALGALLERKLKELSFQEDDELTTGTSLPKRSTAVILLELITALNGEELISTDFHMPRTITLLQAKSKKNERIDDHFSPGSVLEASFSNDTYFSSSIDGNSGQKTKPASHYQHYSLHSDSATSREEGTQMSSHLINRVSKVLQTMNLPNLSEPEITRARQVIFKTELLLTNAASTDLLVGPSLLDEWERLIRATQTHCVRSLRLEKANKGLLRGFLFESMIECLDAKYGGTRLPGRVSQRALVHEIDEDVKKWAGMVGKATDEMIEWEMSHGVGKWTDFGEEGFETGEEIERYMLEYLVEEIVSEL